MNKIIQFANNPQNHHLFDQYSTCFGGDVVVFDVGIYSPLKLISEINKVGDYSVLHNFNFVFVSNK